MAKTAKQQIKQYDGPTREEVDAMADLDVLDAFKILGVAAPKTYAWFETPCIIDIGDGYQRPKDAREFKRRCDREQLLSAYLKRWIAQLSDGEVITQIEHYSETKLSVSEQRYTKREDFKQQLSWLLWPVLVDERSVSVKHSKKKEE